jgi:phosphatidylglycerol:prolipoprotein diacylglycerol transferase
MMPILLSVGPVHVYSFSVFLILSWCIFSFVFWRALRSDGTDEDKIFDLTFYSTLIAFVFSRAFFVLFNWDLFAETPLRILALWVQPGLSLYGGFLGCLLTLVFVSRRAKVRLGQVLDSFTVAFPAAFAVGLVGAFLDGSTVGTIVDVPWALRVAGHVGKRHPIQIYEGLAIIFIMIVMHYIRKKGMRDKWPYGAIGVWFFMLYSTSMFILEFAKESRVYWMSLSANQWILVALFAEAVGAFYVRGGGRERIRPIVYRIQTGITAAAGGIYAKFSKRDS